MVGARLHSSEPSMKIGGTDLQDPTATESVAGFTTQQLQRCHAQCVDGDGPLCVRGGGAPGQCESTESRG